MTKLHETPQDCPALAEAILPNGQTLYCQFDNYDQLKNFQIESGGKPCLVQFDRDNNVKTVQHNFNHDSLDWRKDWELKDRDDVNRFELYDVRPWAMLEMLFNRGMYYAMDNLYNELKKVNWERPRRKMLIRFIANNNQFDIHELTYPVVNQTISEGIKESMGVIV